MMEESGKKLDMKELGRRFKQIRQHLGLTQTEVANQLGTSQLMIYRTEKGESILSPLLLSTILFYSKSVSLEALFSKNFDIEDERVFDKNYALNSIVKAKLNLLREEVVNQLSLTQKEIQEQLDAASELL
jgi:transcriptional regulator with XRE-family HTH domain